MCESPCVCLCAFVWFSCFLKGRIDVRKRVPVLRSCTCLEVVARDRNQTVHELIRAGKMWVETLREAVLLRKVGDAATRTPPQSMELLWLNRTGCGTLSSTGADFTWLGYGSWREAPNTRPRGLCQQPLSIQEKKHP